MDLVLTGMNRGAGAGCLGPQSLQQLMRLRIEGIEKRELSSNAAPADLLKQPDLRPMGTSARPPGLAAASATRWGLSGSRSLAHVALLSIRKVTSFPS